MDSSKHLTATTQAGGPEATLLERVRAGDKEALLVALRRGETYATEVMVRQHAEYVQRVLVRVLGFDDEIEDVLHETFARALENIGQLQDAAKMRSWLSSIAVFTARGMIRKRSRSRWNPFVGSDDKHEPMATTASPEASASAAAVYRVLDKMKPDLRIAFALRFIDGMKLREVAEACDVSMATAKRRIATAEKHFFAMAKRDPALADWIEQHEMAQRRKADAPVAAEDTPQ